VRNGSQKSRISPQKSPIPRYISAREISLCARYLCKKSLQHVSLCPTNLCKTSLQHSTTDLSNTSLQHVSLYTSYLCNKSLQHVSFSVAELCCRDILSRGRDMLQRFVAEISCSAQHTSATNFCNMSRSTHRSLQHITLDVCNTSQQISATHHSRSLQHITADLCNLSRNAAITQQNNSSRKQPLCKLSVALRIDALTSHKCFMTPYLTNTL